MGGKYSYFLAGLDKVSQCANLEIKITASSGDKQTVITYTHTNSNISINLEGYASTPTPTPEELALYGFAIDVEQGYFTWNPNVVDASTNKELYTDKSLSVTTTVDNETPHSQKLSPDVTWVLNDSNCADVKFEQTSQAPTSTAAGDPPSHRWSYAWIGWLILVIVVVVIIILICTVHWNDDWYAYVNTPVGVSPQTTTTVVTTG